MLKNIIVFTIFLTTFNLLSANEDFIAYLRNESSSTGNIADAVEQITGSRAWLNPDIKSIFEKKIVGPAVTVLMKPKITTAKIKNPPYHLEVLEESPKGSVIVYVMEDSENIAAIGNLMTTTAKINNLEGFVIDGAARDISAIKKLNFPVYTKKISPATSVGKMVPFAKNIPVICGDVTVNPNDIIVGDLDGVVVIPRKIISQVVKLLRDFDNRESKMLPIIKQEKSILKAIEKFNRY